MKVGASLQRADAGTVIGPVADDRRQVLLPKTPFTFKFVIFQRSP